MFYKVFSAKLAVIMIVYVIGPVFEDKTENFRFFKKGNYGGLLNSFQQMYLFDRIIGILFVTRVYWICSELYGTLILISFPGLSPGLFKIESLSQT